MYVDNNAVITKAHAEKSISKCAKQQNKDYAHIRLTAYINALLHLLCHVLTSLNTVRNVAAAITGHREPRIVFARFSLGILIVLITTENSIAFNFDSQFCNEEQALNDANNTASTLGKTVEKIDDNICWKSYYINDDTNGNEYKFYYPTNSCEEICKTSYQTVNCAINQCVPEYYIEIAGWAGMLTGFLFGLALILGSWWK